MSGFFINDLGDRLLKPLKRMSDLTGLPMSALARLAISQMLDRVALDLALEADAALLDPVKTTDPR